MDDKHQEFRHSVKKIYHTIVAVFSLVGIVACFLIYMLTDPGFSAFRESDTSTSYTAIDKDENWDTIENGIHIRTGLKEGEGLMETVNNCTNCHSAKLVTQNRMDANRWATTIDWMQETQNLWDLGQNEEIIINYLVTNYPVLKKGRRAALENIEWYELED
ncbi:monoheme cytochrome C [Dokdonia sp.]|uniref:monoheme cytochrome C n=1 Tax=Dokdonia sp. TaxID=2024995 RepID=UPI003264AA7D